MRNGAYLCPWAVDGDPAAAGRGGEVTQRSAAAGPGGIVGQQGDVQ